MRLAALCFLFILSLSACTPTNLTAASTQVGQSAAASDGLASWYGPNFAGRQTANGEIFDPSQLTAAHKTLPFGTQVRVTNLNNGRSVVVRINDRGPFKPGRVIDLSRAAAERIGMIGSGTAPVSLELLNDADAPEPASPSGPTGVSLQTVVDRTLQGYSVASSRYAPGTLLLLKSAKTNSPLMVRVVSDRAPQGVDMLISADLYEHLGEGVTVFEANSQ